MLTDTVTASHPHLKKIKLVDASLVKALSSKGMGGRVEVLAVVHFYFTLKI